MINVILIGASGSIGRALYHHFSKLPEYNPVGIDLALSDTAEFACEIKDFESVSSVFDLIHQEYGNIDCIINLVGKIHNQPFYNVMGRSKYIKLNVWDEILNLNLTTAFIISNAYHHYCTANKLKMNLIHFSSVTANGNPGQLAYSVAKSGIETMTKTLARELGNRGHRINAIAPGYIDVDSTHKALSDAQIEKLTQKIPMRCLGDVKSISLSIQMLIEAQYINGTIIAVDGGYKI